MEIFQQIRIFSLGFPWWSSGLDFIKTSNAGGASLILDQGTKSPHASQPKRKNKKKRERERDYSPCAIQKINRKKKTVT